MAINKNLFKFRSAKITYPEIIKNRNRIVMKDNPRVEEAFEKNDDVKGSTLIYSMYHGYLPKLKPFWDKHNSPIIQIHTSGHAYIEELQKFVNAIKPKLIIPNHTFYPKEYNKYFGDNIKILKDKETIVL